MWGKIKITPEDKLFSEYIRRRAIQRVHGCEKCKAPLFDVQKDNGTVLPAWRLLECSHFHGRRKQSVRYHEDNAAGLCFTCHQHLGENPHEHDEWFKERLGERRFELLNIQAQQVVKPDVAAIRLYLKALLARLKEEV